MNKLLIVLGALMISPSYASVAALSNNTTQQNVDGCGFARNNITESTTTKVNNLQPTSYQEKEENQKECYYTTVAEVASPGRGSPDQRGDQGGSR